jgi:hypothetical protein
MPRIIMKTLAFIVLAALTIAAEPMPLKNEGIAKWGWTAFGHGVEDSGVNATEGFFWIAVNWTASTWGNGTFYKRDEPMDVSPYKKISLVVSAQQPTKTKIQIQLLTADNAVFGSDPNAPYTIKDGEETLIETDITAMVPIQAEKDQREFIPDQDLKKVDRVQIIFLKPEGDETKNVLKFKDMKLIP